MKMNKLKLSLIFLGAMMLPLPTSFMGTSVVSDVIAASSTKNMSVNASIPANCNFTGGAVTLSFGTYDPIGTNATTDLDSTTTFDVRCNKGTSATLGMDTGSNAANATSTNRAMTDGTDYLDYEIYSDSARTSIWGDIGGSFGSTVAYNATSASPVTQDVYGQVPAGQTNAQVGTYSDTVTITVDF